MNINQTFELSMTLDTKKFNKLKRRLHSDKVNHADRFLVSEGITVTFHDNQYKPKVKLNVTPKWFLGDDEPDYSKLNQKLEEYITKNFGSKYQLDDFSLSGMALTTDINVHERERVTDYVKVLQRIGKVKGFSPLSDGWLDDISFHLMGNSNCIEFWVYDLERLLSQQLDEADCERSSIKSAIKKSEGIIRVEVNLTKPKAIRIYTKEADVAKQITDLSQKSETVFMDTFVRIIPFGDFYKKDRTVEIIRKEVTKEKMRRRMLYLVNLIPEKKSLLLAQKALNYRKIDELMDYFAYLDLSPVTICKRHNIKKLDNLYKFL